MLRLFRFAVLLWILLVAAGPAAAERLRWDTPLTGDWQVQPATDPSQSPAADQWVAGELKDWRSMKLAGSASWVGQIKRSDIHRLWFRRTFDAPTEARGRRVLIEFRRLAGDAIVFVNGRRVDEQLRPGGIIDITEAVAFGRSNELRVYITRDYYGISRGYEQDLLRYITRKHSLSDLSMSRWALGITGPVTLKYRPASTYVRDLFVRSSWRNKQLSIDVELARVDQPNRTTVEAVVRDHRGNEVLKVGPAARKTDGQQMQVVLSSDWADPIPWQLGAPYLYTAQVTVRRGASVVDRTRPVPFGFREIWTEGRHIYINGQPTRFRLHGRTGNSANEFRLYQLLGASVFYQQASPNLWWRDRDETPIFNANIIEQADEEGVGLLMPAPNVLDIRKHFNDNPAVQQAYQREVGWFLGHYRDHPSILAWIIGHNTFNPLDGIHPHTMGQRQDYKHPQAEVLRRASELTKAVDGTRLVFSHADGNILDIATANVYTNLAPLQEREDWPMRWARQGDMPYAAVEFGQPIAANFIRGKQLLLSEYLAIYLGDTAYQREDSEARRLLSVPRPSVWNIWRDVKHFPAYWDFQRLFVGNTDRAWRAWGINGGYYYWDFDMGFGDPPGYDRDRQSHYLRYQRLARMPKITSRPDWANENFDLRSENMQPLLVYIAGTPRHTNKTHLFHPGETIQKQVAAVWDGPGARQLQASWQVVDAQGSSIDRGGMNLHLEAGDLRFAPIEFVAPDTDRRMDLKLKLTIHEDTELVATDELPLTIMARSPEPDVDRRIVLFEPDSTATREWLNKLGVCTVAWNDQAELRSTDLLIVGRDALASAYRLPFTPEDVAAGLNVIIMEQKPTAWEWLGFATCENMPRYMFSRDDQSPVLRGIEPSDLINWRGTPDLLPQFRRLRTHDTRRAPKWTNTHALACSSIKVPEVVGFRAVTVCEFDLQYTPLLQWNHGRGRVWYNSLSVEQRIGSSPPATRMMSNLLALAGSSDANRSASRRILYRGNGEDRVLLERLGAEITNTRSLDQPSRTILILGAGFDGLSLEQLDRYAAEGATIVVLAHDQAGLRKLGLRGEKRAIQSIRLPWPACPLLRGIGGSMIRWRCPLEIWTLQEEPMAVSADGVIAARDCGRGRWVYIQVKPDMVDQAVGEDTARAEAVQLTKVRLRQLVATVLTNVGVGSSPLLAQRVTTPTRGPRYRWLGSWDVLGPIIPQTREIQDILAKPYRGEEAAIQGNTNVNRRYRQPDGSVLDFRKTVRANDNGFVDLGRLLGAREKSVSYVTTQVHSESAREARLRLGVDYWLVVWVNGEMVYRTAPTHGPPAANAIQVNIDLKEGANIITMKVIAGSKGYGFWANLAEPDVESALDSAAEQIKLYQPLPYPFDPYDFHYW